LTTALKPLSKCKDDRRRRRTKQAGENIKHFIRRRLCHLYVDSDRVRFEAHAVAIFLYRYLFDTGPFCWAVSFFAK